VRLRNDGHPSGPSPDITFSFNTEYIEFPIDHSASAARQSSWKPWSKKGFERSIPTSSKASSIAPDGKWASPNRSSYIPTKGVSNARASSVGKMVASAFSRNLRDLQFSPGFGQQPLSCWRGFGGPPRHRAVFSPNRFDYTRIRFWVDRVRLRATNDLCSLRSANPFAYSDEQETRTKKHSNWILLIYWGRHYHRASRAQEAPPICKFL